MNETRILVVDDEEDLCEILKFNLENEGYEVDTANSAEEALNWPAAKPRLHTPSKLHSECTRNWLRAVI